MFQMKKREDAALKNGLLLRLCAFALTMLVWQQGSGNNRYEPATYNGFVYSHGRPP